MNSQPGGRKRLKIIDLLRPHAKALTLGMLAVAGGGIANLLEPWPLKIVLDNVLQVHPNKVQKQFFFLSALGDDRLAILKFAALSVLAVAALGAVCSYA